MSQRRTPKAVFLLVTSFVSAALAGCLTPGDESTLRRSADASSDEPARDEAGEGASREGAPAGGTVDEGKGQEGDSGGSAQDGAPSREVTKGCDALLLSAPAGADSGEEAVACRCTRRPGPGESFQCPPGADQSVEARIGPEGGVLELSGTASTKGVSVRIEIPPGALSKTVSLRLTETSVAPPAGFVDWSPVYHLEPAGLAFTRPVTVRVPWSSNDGFVDVDLALYASGEENACALAPLADSYVNAGFNQGSLRQTGRMMVGRPRTAAESACP